MTARKKTKEKAKTKGKATRKKRVSSVINQVKEPLSLLETLRDEGMARVVYMLGMAGGMAKNIKKENLSTQLKEVVQLLGLATKDELRALKRQIRKLESRIEDLESQFEDATEETAEAEDEDEEEDEGDEDASDFEFERSDEEDEE